MKSPQLHRELEISMRAHTCLHVYRAHSTHAKTKDHTGLLRNKSKLTPSEAKSETSFRKHWYWPLLILTPVPLFMLKQNLPFFPELSHSFCITQSLHLSLLSVGSSRSKAETSNSDTPRAVMTPAHPFHLRSFLRQSVAHGPEGPLAEESMAPINQGLNSVIYRPTQSEMGRMVAELHWTLLFNM